MQPADKDSKYKSNALTVTSAKSIPSNAMTDSSRIYGRSLAKQGYVLALDEASDEHHLTWSDDEGKKTCGGCGIREIS